MVTGPEGGSTGWDCHPLTDVSLIPQIRVPESGHRQDALCGLFSLLDNPPRHGPREAVVLNPR